MADNTIHQILWAAIVIMGIFGVLYMMNFNNPQNMMTGIAVLFFAGVLIFIDAFIAKYQRS